MYESRGKVNLNFSAAPFLFHQKPPGQDVQRSKARYFGKGKKLAREVENSFSLRNSLDFRKPAFPEKRKEIVNFFQAGCKMKQGVIECNQFVTFWLSLSLLE